MTPIKKQWLLVVSAFLAGLLISGGIGGYFVWRLVKVIYLERDLSTAAETQTILLYLKKIDRGTTNAIIQLQEDGRERLSEYIHDVEQSKKDGRKLNDMTLDTYQTARAYLFPFTFGEKREEDFFWGKMLPVAQEFVKGNGLAVADFSTNNISKYRINFFTDDRPGCLADLKLKGGYSFGFLSNGTNTEVRNFNDGQTKTYFVLDSAPKEEIDAIKTLSLRNKLNDKTALELAKKFFLLQGHTEEDFHPPMIHQSYWVGKNDISGKLPYYEITWYRKDVKKEDLEAGKATIPEVIIEISGIDSHLISYTKAFMPIGTDFEINRPIK